MRLKAGDLCVIINHPLWHGLEHKEWIGREVTIVEGFYFLGEECYYTDPDTEDQRGWRGVCLQLRRPPGWDKWIFDTSDVKNEQETQVPEDGAIYFMTDDGVKVVRP